MPRDPDDGYRWTLQSRLHWKWLGFIPMYSRWDRDESSSQLDYGNAILYDKIKPQLDALVQQEENDRLRWENLQSFNKTRRIIYPPAPDEEPK
jgi:hypothetical protein